MMYPRVAVLLAAYKGHKYIYEQVLSLLGQCGVSVDIFIRVDGDDNLFSNEVIQLAMDYENIHFLKGDLISSPSSNFYKLVLEMEDYSFDYYALCDQDDIWSNYKLNRAIASFSNNLIQGYSSGFTTFNSSGRKKIYKLGKKTEFDHLFQSAGPGCTFVLNIEALIFLQNFLKDNHSLLEVLAHDWLIYFVFRVNKMEWVLDEESHLFYRQHNANVAGVNSGLAAKVKRFRLLFSGWYFTDLKILFSFAKNLGFSPSITDIFNLRRSKMESLFIWLYLWLFFKFNH